MQGDFPPRGPRFNEFPGPGPGNFMGPGGPNQSGPGLLGPPPMYQGPGQQFDPRFGPPQIGPGPMNVGPPREMGPPLQMGGPQRFMGPGIPPGPPPGLPMIEPGKEIWVETTSDQGKTYYYHSKTRKSIWKKPSDDNVQIITQNEANALAAATAAGLVPPMLGPGPNRGSTQSGLEHQDGNADEQNYHASEQGPRNNDDEQTGEQDIEAKPVLQEEQKPPPIGLISPGPSPVGPRLPTVGLIGPGPLPARMPGFPGPTMPFGAPLPFMPGPMMMPSGPVWRAHKAPDGRTYYYNITTMETQWNKPKELEDLETPKEATENGQKNEDETITGESAPKRARFADEEEAKPKVSNVPKPLTEEEKAKQRQKPIATEPVPGTPWCVVWTGDEKVFFYNPTTKLSMWERPDELKGRSDIDKILADPPHKRTAETELANPIKAAEKQETDDDDASQKKGKSKKATEEPDVPGKSSVPFVPLEERIKHFKEMLYERQVSAFSTWDKELHKIVFDPRYTMLSAKERKQVFDSYVKTRADEERKEKKAHLLKVKEEFKQLLEEVLRTHNKMSFSEFAGKYGREPRFKAVDKMRERETLYNEFLKDAKQRKTTEAKEKSIRIRTDFMALLEEKRVEKYSRWSKVYEKIHSDPRYSAVDSTMMREQMWKEYLDRKQSDKRNETKEDDGDAEKKRRTEESMKARVEQVQREKEERSREIDSERQKHKQDEAVQHFKALLSDMVKGTDQTWSEVRRQLRKEPRWGLASLLSKEEKEKFFENHLESLNKRKRLSFRKLLEETPQIELTTTWKEVRKLIKEDPRYTKFSSSDRKREREFEDVMKDKKSAAKSEFRELLKETKLITHKSKELTKSNPQHMKEIIAILENDKRYLVMDCMSRERDDLIYYYMDDLHRKGPPPPPTATEPSRRSERK